MVDALKENDSYVSELRSAIREGDIGLKHVPALLKRILKEERWKRRIVQQTNEMVEFESFIDFVVTKPLQGLGADLDLIKRICGNDSEALDLIDQAVTGKPGGPIGNRKRSSIHNTTNDNIMVGIMSNEPKQGTSRQYAFRRLRKSRPDLHAKILAGEMTANAAMIEAGFREKRIAIPLHPERAARIIRRHFSGEQVRQLVELLA